MRKITIFIVISLVVIRVYNYTQSKSPRNTTTPTSNTTSQKGQTKPVEVVLDKLNIPWSLVFLPDGTLLFTERSGAVKQVNLENGQLPTLIHTVRDIKAIGEGGLLGIEIHPDFTTNHFVYLYYTYASDTRRTLNKVTRFTYSQNTLSDEKNIVTNIPGNSNHNGGRIKFGPDGFLYITTGDSQDPSLSQDTNSLAGKILRVTDEGNPAPGNSFGNLVYSYGHRNPQGLTWDNRGQLWSTEHGPNAGDELNLISSGKNYGWPSITRSQTQEGMVAPVIHSGDQTWAPSGIVYFKQFLYFTGLRGTALYKYNPTTGELTEYLKKEFGRLRDVIVGPDSLLYISTSNRDGRAIAPPDGDKILRIDPKQFP